MKNSVSTSATVGRRRQIAWRLHGAGDSMFLSSCSNNRARQEWPVITAPLFPMKGGLYIPTNGAPGNHVCSGAKIFGFNSVNCESPGSCTSRSMKGYEWGGRLGSAPVLTPWILHDRAANWNSGCHPIPERKYLEGAFHDVPTWVNCQLPNNDWSFSAKNSPNRPLLTPLPQNP